MDQWLFNRLEEWKHLVIGVILSYAVLAQKTANRNIVIRDRQRMGGNDNRNVAPFESGLNEDQNARNDRNYISRVAIHNIGEQKIKDAQYLNFETMR